MEFTYSIHATRADAELGERLRAATAEEHAAWCENQRNGDGEGIWTEDGELVQVRRDRMGDPWYVEERTMSEHLTYDPTADLSCDCSEEYGPCEEHGETVVRREGASTRTADELAVIYCDDAAALLEELGGTVLDTDREIISDAWGLLETERRHGVAWFPEDDAGEMLDECLRLGDALAADLSGLAHFTYWDDGYWIVRVHEDCPLLDD